MSILLLHPAKPLIHGAQELEPSARAGDVLSEEASPVTPTLVLNTSETSLTEYPAPVSADPTVPDPTSIAHTPASPVDSIASSSGDKEPPSPVPIHAALLPAFRKMERAHSASGLFTPMTEGTSGSATPEQVDSNMPPPKAKETGEREEELELELIDPDTITMVPEVEITPAVEESTGEEPALFMYDSTC